MQPLIDTNHAARTLTMVLVLPDSCRFAAFNEFLNTPAHKELTDITNSIIAFMSLGMIIGRNCTILEILLIVANVKIFK